MFPHRPNKPKAILRDIGFSSDCPLLVAVAALIRGWHIAPATVVLGMTSTKTTVVSASLNMQMGGGCLPGGKDLFITHATRARLASATLQLLFIDPPNGNVRRVSSTVGRILSCRWPHAISILAAPAFNFVCRSYGDCRAHTFFHLGQRI